MNEYENVPMDLADATLVALAEKLNIFEIATLDSDFNIYRTKENKALKNLLTSVF